MQRRRAVLRLCEWKDESELDHWVARDCRARDADGSGGGARADAARHLGGKQSEGRTEDCGDSNREGRWPSFVRIACWNHGRNRESAGPRKNRRKFANAIPNGGLRGSAGSGDFRKGWSATGFRGSGEFVF